MRKFFRCVFRIVAAALLAVAAFGVYSFVVLDSYHATEDVSKIGTGREYGLLLGTSKFLKSGRPNLQYNARIDAAVKLYKAGKIARIIASGDNRDKYYNEPAQMKRDLIAGGVPESAISTDPLGLRTYDSLKRCRGIFGVPNPVIITQQAHCRRALFLAESLGMDAEGFAAATPDFSKDRLVVDAREMLAKMKAVGEVYISSAIFANESLSEAVKGLFR